jgi:hypothetical protein
MNYTDSPRTTDDSEAASIVFLIMVGLLLGTILRLLADWTNIPYSPIVIIVGFIIRASSGDRYDSLNHLMDANAYLI